MGTSSLLFFLIDAKVDFPVPDFPIKNKFINLFSINILKYIFKNILNI